jgi:hypothetical protein
MIYFLAALAGLLGATLGGIGAFRPENLHEIASIVPGLARMSGGSLGGILLVISIANFPKLKDVSHVRALDWLTLIYVQAGVTAFWAAFILYFYETSQLTRTSIPLTFTSLGLTTAFSLLAVRRIFKNCS